MVVEQDQPAAGMARRKDQLVEDRRTSFPSQENIHGNEAGLSLRPKRDSGSVWKSHTEVHPSLLRWTLWWVWCWAWSLQS